MKEVRTRFAPSPTGFMHIGGVRTALYAYLVAKQNNGKFILRIEDTDQSRFVEGATEVIYNTLRDLGLIWDEGPDIGGPVGPYVQSERKGHYLEYAKKLVNEGKAYYCFCNEERLEELKKAAELSRIAYKYDGHCRSFSLEEALKRVEAGEEYVIRFKMPNEGTTVFEDCVYGTIVVNNDELEDLIMIKSDGMPTYNFANIIDDHEMGISHVIRGNEYVSSTPKYVLMYQALGFEVPEFIHLPVIKKNKDSDKKLSKRDGDATVDVLKAKGYLNAAIINMLALTGWSSGKEQEIFTLEELVEVFDVKGIGKGNAIFDIEKLNWLNSHYIKELAKEDLYNFLYPFVSKNYNLEDKSREWLDELFELFRRQLSFGQEIVDLVSIFFTDDYTIDDDAKEFMEQEGIDKTIEVFINEIKKMSEWSLENINNAITATKEKALVKGKMLYMPIMIKLIGQMHGPELPNIVYLFERGKVLDRLSK
ncbi:MAG: glutamate--tRNA ligase [Bacilli bacterium]|nr:glutamate--tRNA ligase [Bacilli bacterium]